jgi:hypothetical protein
MLSTGGPVAVRLMFSLFFSLQHQKDRLLPLNNNQCGESESGWDPDSNGLAKIFPEKRLKMKKFNV